MNSYKFSIKGIDFKMYANYIGDKPADWSDGKNYNNHKIVIIRNGKRRSFEFWASMNNPEVRNKLDFYGVMECLISDCCIPENFDDFCSEFGYDTDSRKAEKTFKLCKKYNKKMSDLFSEDEIRKIDEKLRG